MIIDQLFEDNNKKKLNETTSRNYEQGMTEGEVEMPTGQVTGIDSQTDTPPNRSFSIKVVGTFVGPGRNMEAQQLFEALQSILPRDYPYVTWNNQKGTPQRRVIDDINNDGFSIVKQGINIQDVAETIASKFEAKGIPAEVIDGGIYEEQGMAEAYDPGQASKYIAAATKAAKIVFNHARFWNRDFRSELENQYGFDPDSPGKESFENKAKELIKWLESKGCELSYDPNSPIDFSLSMPDQSAPYEFNILDMIQSGEVNESSAVPPADPVAPAEYTPKVGEEILWRPRFAKMVPVPVTVVAVAPGKLKIKLQSPRMIQNYGKDTIVVDLEKSDVTPKQGIAEADRLPRPDNWKPPVLPNLGPRPAPQKQIEVGDVVGFTPQTHDYKSSGKVFKAEVLEIGGRLGRSGVLLKLLNPEDVAANGGNPIMKVSSMLSKIQNPYVEPAQQGVTESRQRRLNEAMLMEDPVYRKFKGVGRYIAERKMSEKEILQVFADAESGMTDKGTGANRTFLGRGKDTTMDFAGGVKDAMTSVLNSIQNSTPVSAVDVAYDQATDALANVAGGQKGAVMNAIKKYRNLVKQYPKTAGFAKAALVAIAGLATGGAGLPAIAGLTYALDSAIKGDKLSSVLGKGAGAAALTAAGQAAFGGNATPGDDFATIDAVDTPGGVEATDYVVKKGDTLSDIAKANKVSVDDLMKANAGQTIVKPNGESITWNNDNPLTDVNPMGDYQGPGTGVQQDYSVSTAPKIANPDVLAAGQTIKLPAPTGATPYAGDVGLAGDTWNKIGAGQYPASQISANQAAKYGLKESIKFKILPAEKLIDQKSTVLSWALSESVGRRSISLNLTTLGTYTVFENVDRYRKAIMELKGVPGSTRPDQYRPDMPGGAGVTSKPGLIGKGLNWLDKKASQVGGALSNFGHQFTTGVTKEKLKMNWHQAGKPSDSDQLAAWLTKQGVPQEVVTTVYGKMGIPYVAPASAEPASAEPVAEPGAPATGGAQKSLPFYGTNPDTNKAWTRDELLAKGTAPASAAPAPAPAAAATTAQSPAGFNASNVMNLPGMEKYAKQPAPAKTPNFGAGPGGYSNVTTSFKQPGATTPAAVPGTKVVSGGPTPDEQAKLAQRIAQATAKPVAEMLSMVETKEDVAKIKQFIDQTFVKHGAVTESAFAVRNRLIDHVTQVGAQRRREFARKG